MALLVDIPITSAAVQSAAELGESTSKLAVSVLAARWKVANVGITGAVSKVPITVTPIIGKLKPKSL